MTPPKPAGKVSMFALICVAITTLFILGMIVWSTIVLTGRDWCTRAMGAAQVAERPESAITSCYQLLTQQVDALAWNSHIFAGIIALCLLVLMVIVVARGEVAFKASRSGVSGHIGSDIEPEEAAQIVADEAQDAADEVAYRRPRRTTRRRSNVDDPDGGM